MFMPLVPLPEVEMAAGAAAAVLGRQTVVVFGAVYWRFGGSFITTVRVAQLVE
jgi:hypothetical protein